MFEHRARLSVLVLIGVGAAFDFHTGRVVRAPEWMRGNGLEWMFRLIQEPKRLWRVLGVWAEFAVLELLGLKKYR